MGDRMYTAGCLAGLGGVAVGLGACIGGELGTPQVERGVRLLRAVEGLMQSIGAVLDREDRLPLERGALQARSLLSEEAFERAWKEGRDMTGEQAVAYALAA
jgi:hypothetical protein